MPNDERYNREALWRATQELDAEREAAKEREEDASETARHARCERERLDKAIELHRVALNAVLSGKATVVQVADSGRFKVEFSRIMGGGERESVPADFEIAKPKTKPAPAPPANASNLGSSIQGQAGGRS